MIGPRLVSKDWGRKMGLSAPGWKTRNRARKLKVDPAATWVKGHEMQTWLDAWTIDMTSLWNVDRHKIMVGATAAWWKTTKRRSTENRYHVILLIMHWLSLWEFIHKHKDRDGTRCLYHNELIYKEESISYYWPLAWHVGIYICVVRNEPFSSEAS